MPGMLDHTPGNTGEIIIPPLFGQIQKNVRSRRCVSLERYPLHTVNGEIAVIIASLFNSETPGNDTPVQSIIESRSS